MSQSDHCYVELCLEKQPIKAHCGCHGERESSQSARIVVAMVKESSQSKQIMVAMVKDSSQSEHIEVAMVKERAANKSASWLPW